MKAGFDAVLFKPVALTQIKATFESVVPVLSPADFSPGHVAQRSSPGAEQLLPIDEARRIRSERTSRILTEAECQAAICAGFVRFQADYLGWRSERIRAHFIKDLLVIRVQGGLTLAECHLAKASTPESGRDLIKQFRKQLLEVARPILESMVYEVTGVKPQSMHHDISTVTGEEIVVFRLAEPPRFEYDPGAR
ncbi:MAG: DUF2294 domain-containing protein [Planctomycetia bacterium]|nr:DUF2294 domain-containing protein [Planctomycetia bacterium]